MHSYFNRSNCTLTTSTAAGALYVMYNISASRFLLSCLLGGC